MTAAIILAAGASTRLGHPKQLIELDGEILLARAVRIAAESGLHPIFAVLPPALDFGYALQQLPAAILFNHQASEGIASSIRLGIESAALLHATGAVLLTCDQPALTAAHLKALIADPTTRTGSAYAGRIGVPAYFPAADFPALLALTGDRGARDLLRNARSIPNEALALDIDTPADLAALTGSSNHKAES